jgi:hypothetical protein
MAADYPAVMSACGAFGITCKVNIDKNFLIQIIRQKINVFPFSLIVSPHFILF